MKRINLVSYGFVRTPEEDFSDDGNRFQVYHAGNSMRVSKLVSNGRVYISARYEGPSQVLLYEEYSQLPKYKSLDALNGIDLDSVTEEALSELYNNCLEYEAAFLAKAKEVKLPTANELFEARRCVLDKRTAELAELEERIKSDPVRFAVALSDSNSYKVTNFGYGIKRLKEETDTHILIQRFQNSIGSSYARTLVDSSTIAHDMQDSYYYKLCKEYLDEVGL